MQVKKWVIENGGSNVVSVIGKSPSKPSGAVWAGFVKEI